MRVLTEVETTKKVRLDVNDKKILSSLALNARLPITKISKGIHLSRDAIAHRIKMYEKNGLIQGCKTIVNIQKLGFTNYHLFLQLNNPSEEDEKKFIEKLKSFPFIRAILKYSGKYDLELAVIAKSVPEFEEFLEKILNSCSQYLLDYEIVIITKNYKRGSFPRSFLDVKEDSVKKKVQDYILDKKDISILRILSNDARHPVYKIANKVKLSADAVTYRIKKMVNADYITRFVPSINYVMLGYSVYAVLMDIRSLAKSQDVMLKEFFNTDKNILWAVKTIGKYNVLFYITSKTPAGVHETILNLRNHFPEKIRAYETFIAYEQYKYTYLPEIVT